MRTDANVALLALLTLGSCGGSPTSAPHAAPAKVHDEGGLTVVELTPEAESRLGIRTSAVTRQNVEPSRAFAGELVAAPGATATMTAPWAGTVAEVAGGGPRAGATVRKGARLLRLVSLERDVAGEAERALRSAEARTEAARSAHSRAQQLLEERAGSQRALEQAQAELTQAEAELASVRAWLAGLDSVAFEAGGVLSIVAPRAAVVMRQSVVAGQTVSAGTPLFELASVDPLWVRVPVFSGDLAAVRAGSSARIADYGMTADGSSWHKAEPVHGPPTADPAAATSDLYFELPNAEGMFRIGQRVTVRLALSGATEALTVPASAVLYDVQGGTWVYENPSPQRFVRRRVEVPYITDDVAVLTEGPTAGTLVVSVGAAELFGTEFGPGK